VNGAALVGEASVNIGIPTHGRPRFLTESIGSVLSQTFDSWTLTIAANGVRDLFIRDAVDPFLSDPRIRLITTEEELGAAENATRAIEDGAAAHVAVLHDDDLWDPEFLARRVAFLEQHETCGFVFSHCKYIGADGQVVYRYTADLMEGMQPSASFVPALYRQNMIAMPTVVMRRAAYEAVGAAFSESVLFSDWEMWLRLAAQFDVGFLDSYDASYRLHTGQTTFEHVSRLGEHRLGLLDEVDVWLPDSVPAIDRRRARSGAHFRSSYDAFARGEHRRGVSDLKRALRVYPTAIVDPKMAALAFSALRFRIRQRALWNPKSSEPRDES
jgi:glycosyltransferase involved in cell wall biosynthesis